MKKTSHSPVVYLALILISLSFALTLSVAKKGLTTGATFSRESSESAAPVLEEAGSSFIWQSILHRF